MARRVASVVKGTADDESLPHKMKFKIRNTPNNNLKFDDYKRKSIAMILPY